MSEDFPFSARIPDPHCLHCVLAKPIQVFADAHPDTPRGQMLGEILQIAADFAASTVPEDEQPAALKAAHELLERLMRQSFAGARGYLKERQ